VLCSDGLFYANFNSQFISEISTEHLPPDWNVTKNDLRGITSLDVIFPIENDVDYLEVVLGKQEGSIWRVSFKVLED